MKRVSKNLTKAVTLSVLLMLPYGMAWAETFEYAITGADDTYTDYRTYDKKTNTYTYTLGNGAILDLKTYYQNHKPYYFNTIGINAENENIVINGALNIKMEKGETQNSGNVHSAMSINGENLVLDRRGGGDIELTGGTGSSAAVIDGDNNKMYLGNGNITLTTNTGTPTAVLDVNGSGNLLVYAGNRDENKKILHYANGNDDYSRGIGVRIATTKNKNNNKVILGYTGDYSDNDLSKFNDLDMLPKVVNDLETVTIEIEAKNDNTGKNADVSATGIELSGVTGTADKNSNNIIAAGDLIITAIAEGKGNAEGHNSSGTYGINNSNSIGNTTNYIFAKSVDIESTIGVDQAPLLYAYGVYNGTFAETGNAVIEIANKSEIDVKAKTNGDSNIVISGIYNANKYIYEGEIIQKGAEAIVNTSDIKITTNSTGGIVENVGIRADGGRVIVNGATNISVNASGAAEGSKVYGIWSTFGGNINVNGTTNISTSGGQEIAVVAGTENWTDVAAEPDGGINNINLNYGLGSKITGDIISGYGGNIVIGMPESTEEGISTFSARNNNGTLTLKGDALSANGGKLDINLTAGSTWTGRADDYQDAALPNWKDDHEKQFNPKFSHSIAANGNVNVTLAKGATWNVTGQSWLTTLEGNGVVDLTKDEGSDAVHIGTVKGNNTFVVNLKPDGLDTSDMIYVQNGTSDAQTLQINNRDEVLSGMKVGDALRFATVTKAGEGFGNITDGAETFGKSTSINDAGIFNVDFDIIYKDYNDEMEGDLGTDQTYNGGNFSTNKPGQDYVDNVYGGKKDTSEINTLEETTETESNPKHVYIVRNSVTKENQSDAGKTIINMSRANYKNAIYMDRLNKRMGEMRYVNAEEEQGLWVRLRHDRIGQSGDFRSMNTMYEVGYDVKQSTDNGEHRIGMAIDYMRGSTTYDDIMGKGETKRYGLWLYDTWLGEKGHYTDYIVKWGHLSNDFDIRDKDSLENITGDYSNNVFSVSAEYGKKNDMGNNWYFEPQAQLQLARVTGADYVTTQGSKVNVDGINSLIGRAGFRIGRDMDENSTVYLKADLLHEFMGDQTVTAADATGTLREEFENKGTWYDVGFGFAAKMSKNSYAFMDFEKSFGNDNDETYQINAGMQWSF